MVQSCNKRRLHRYLSNSSNSSINKRQKEEVVPKRQTFAKCQVQVAELDQKFRGGGKSWEPIYILYKCLSKIIGGTILDNFKIFGRKIGKFTLLTETLGGGGRCTPTSH
ncbi:hypothetical protein HanRHA438_Chr14g0644041 [Helianthus annuus]|uniref:Uncharacterized protein n=1 Tax=Helianthus annuus TaxID=4232 RepID=A0A251THR8_HELAN|nr:hypothetical protein HanXRQr2_Chr14g0633131 [Helianthus annuus]KAJ0484955.1 hypothetical protein HanHA89_Chr14g0562671 [Helianthus annuus]KAJ0655504.1 hypothetical protein HanLR1_Chr14g0524991 [Helianthus annuus]KAJ0659196.1 hypothetical protein HanOQP8_Chr14g0523291 [Helianthus annuus]KAJ0852818.1 hypothetical protein HanRHA438_Chr14g0644041 [Helianthus annuus]